MYICTTYKHTMHIYIYIEEDFNNIMKNFNQGRTTAPHFYKDTAPAVSLYQDTKAKLNFEFQLKIA